MLYGRPASTVSRHYTQIAASPGRHSRGDVVFSAPIAVSSGHRFMPSMSCPDPRAGSDGSTPTSELKIAYLKTRKMAVMSAPCRPDRERQHPAPVSVFAQPAQSSENGGDRAQKITYQSETWTNVLLVRPPSAFGKYPPQRNAVTRVPPSQGCILCPRSGKLFPGPSPPLSEVTKINASSHSLQSH